MIGVLADTSFFLLILDGTSKPITRHRVPVGRCPTDLGLTNEIRHRQVAIGVRDHVRRRGRSRG